MIFQYSGWKEITNNNQKLEILSLCWGKELKNKTINLIIKALPNLKHLKIGTGFECTKSVFNNMKINKNLKLVEILKDNISTNIKTPIPEMQSLCQKNGITLKVYERIHDIFKVLI